MSPLTCNALALEAEVLGLSELIPVDTRNTFGLRGANNVQVGFEVTLLCKSFFKVTSTPVSWLEIPLSLIHI